MLKEKIQQYLKSEFAKRISSEQDFFFQKGQNALNKWIEMELTNKEIDSIMSLSLDYNEFKKIDTSNRELFPIAQLLFEIVSYCDNKANGKKHHNQYEDSRTFANAGVRMGAWIRNLVDYKFNPQNVTGSIKNAFNYLLDPTNNTTVLSENHRKLIVVYYLKKDYKPVDFTDDLKSIFKNYNLSVLNEDNYTFYISSLIYSFGNEWKPKVSLKFKDLVKKLEKHFISEKLEFSFNELSTRPRYVWISNKSKIIGNDIAHYEIGFRSIPENKTEVYVDIHFESKIKAEKDIFHNTIKILPENLEWFDWQNSKSIGYKEVYKLDDADIVDNITTALEYLEENIGDSIREIISEFPPTNTNSIENKLESMKLLLNQILYGPPGTGKTYNTINKSLEIIGIDTNGKTRDDIKNVFEKKVNEKQIVFTTFHQSMSYEDFIEGIKPHTKNDNVTYAVEDGIFKALVKKALIEYIRKDTDVDEATEFDILYNDFVKSIKPLEGKRQGTFTTKTGVEIMLVEANDASILVKYVWSSNTKKEAEGQHTFSVTKEKLKKVLLEGIEPAKIKNLKSELHPLIGHIHCELFAVYKNFYDFVIANKGEIETIHFDYEELSFEEVKEQFDVLTKEEIKAKKVKPYVIIIDEINRGNVSQIFGELITLIEEDKRLGEDEALEVMLPYSKEKFGVPPNLYIIGTMNTADRSVEALDTALRRRFCFEEIEPDPTLIATKGKLKESNGIIETISLPTVLETINNRIEILSNRDHKIGHSYFMKVVSIEELRDTFKKSIIPLLQEYFYNDYEKIGWVLGEGFFEEKKSEKKTIFTKFFKQPKPEFELGFQLADIDKIDIKKAMLILLGTFKEENQTEEIED